MARHMAQGGGKGKRAKEVFFFEKKKQKTFANWN